VIAELGRRQVGFRSLGDGELDTTTAIGGLVFHIVSALAQFERRLIQESDGEARQARTTLDYAHSALD
jgi:DNA invertase Pin-like site-specific DNA recombinase